MSRMKKKLIKAWKPNPTIIKVDLTNPAQGVTHSLDANLSTHDFAGAAAAYLSAALKQVFPEMKFDVEWVVSLSMDNPAGRYGRFMIVRRGDFEYGGEGNPAIQLTQEEYEELHKDRK